MSALTATPAAMLTTIAEQIKAEHKAAERDVRSSVAHAIRCGQLLLEAKVGIKHGEWEAWIDDNIKLSARAVQGYMRLAKLDATKAQRVADLSLREALKQVGQEYGRKQKQIEKQVDNELRQSAHESAHATARIIDVEPEPMPGATGKQITPEQAPKKMRKKIDGVTTGPALPPSNGMQFAGMAILNLRQIKPDDSERKQAFQTVQEWLDENVRDSGGST